jgi:hypothetical protein
LDPACASSTSVMEPPPEVSTKPCNLGGLTQSPLGFYLFPQRCLQRQPWRRLTLQCPLGCQLPP